MVKNSFHIIMMSAVLFTSVCPMKWMQYHFKKEEGFCTAFYLQVPLRTDCTNEKELVKGFLEINMLDDYEKEVLDIVISVLERIQPVGNHSQKRIRMRQRVVQRLRELFYAERIYTMSPCLLNEDVLIEGITFNALETASATGKAFVENFAQQTALKRTTVLPSSLSFLHSTIIVLNKEAVEVFPRADISLAFLRKYKTALITMLTSAHHDCIFKKRTIFEESRYLLHSASKLQEVHRTLRTTSNRILWNFELLVALCFHEGYASLYPEQSQADHDTIIYSKQKPFFGNQSFVSLAKMAHFLSTKFQQGKKIRESDYVLFKKAFVRYFHREIKENDLDFFFPLMPLLQKDFYHTFPSSKDASFVSNVSVASYLSCSV